MKLTHFTQNEKNESVKVVYDNIISVSNEMFSNRVIIQFIKGDKSQEIKLPIDAMFLVTC